MAEISFRRVGVLIILSLMYITINVFVVLMFDKLIGVDIGDMWVLFSKLVIAISIVGSLYAVFIVYSYGDSKSKDKETTRWVPK